MTVKSHSWEIINETTATKITDLSFFKNNRSGIPIKIRPFFNIDNLVASTSIPITIEYKNITYKGKLRRTGSSAGQTEIWYETELEKVLNNDYPNALSEEQYPLVTIKKVSDTYYIFIFNDKEDDGLTTVISDKEGKKKEYYTTKYERSQKNRNEAIRIHGTTCMACGFNFEKHYGDIGKNFIEVHHIRPLSTLYEEKEINPETDLICVCSNCHRMIHKNKNKIITIEELKKMIK